MPSIVEQRFSEFFENWFNQLQTFQAQLKAATEEQNPNADKLSALVASFTDHYRSYFITKWDLAEEEALPFFRPTWRTPFENCLAWLTDWKPSTVFQILECVKKSPLTAEQTEKVKELREKIKIEEEMMDWEMERRQISSLGVFSYGMIRPARAVIDGMQMMAMEAMEKGMVMTMRSADVVRVKALKGMLDILTMPQRVEFLAAEAAARINMRMAGRMREMMLMNMRSAMAPPSPSTSN